jgi:hypothetical protein
MIALLLLGFWKLQIINSDRYAQMAERNRVRSDRTRLRSAICA